MSTLEIHEPELTFEEFLQKVEPNLKKVLWNQSIPAEDAEDVLQQSLLALVYQWDRIRDPECWLLATLKRQCQLYRRKKRRQIYSTVDSSMLELLSDPAAPAQERADLLCDLENLLKRLPSRCRKLLRLRFHLGYEPLEVARRLGYQASSIGKVTTRCIAALSQELLTAGLSREAVAEDEHEPDPAAARRG